MIDAIVIPVREAIRMVKAYRDGNLSERAQIEVSGAFKDLMEMLSSRNPSTHNKDITHVTSCMRLGDLSARISVEMPGDFAAIKENINARRFRGDKGEHKCRIG